MSEDTPGNREIIRDAIRFGKQVSSEETREGQMLVKYFRELADGTQSWAEVIDGKTITNGGLNIVPRLLP